MFLLLLLGLCYALLRHWPQPQRSAEEGRRQEQVLQQKFQGFLRWEEASFWRKARPQARVWDARTGKRVTDLKSSGAVSSVFFSPDGKMLIINGQMGGASVWLASSSSNGTNAGPGHN